MKRYPKPSRKKSKVARSLPAATPTPVAFFEIKADAPVPIGPASADATQTVELRRPDGWTLRVSGDLAKELAPVMLQKFSTLQGAAT